jgi:hypothetical protein
MSNQAQYNYGFVESAAKEFMEQNPAYLATPANYKVLTDEITKLIDEENADPQNVATYQKAFHRCSGKLELKAAEPIKSFDQFSVEELLALPAREKDKLPDHLLKRMANHEFAEKRRRPDISETDAIFRELFGESGYADSVKNRAILGGWINKRNLGCSLANLQLGIEACSEHLEPSEHALEKMSADQYARQIVFPEFKKRWASAPKTTERGNPPGTNYVSWLHGQ